MRGAVFAVAALLALPMAAHGASITASASGRAQATILQPLTVQMQANLDFGTVASTITGNGTVTISPARDGATYAGSAAPACGSGACTTPHPAQFAVRGEAGRAYTIDVPTSVSVSGAPQDSATLTGPTLTVGALTIRTHSRPAAGNAGLIDANGADKFELGGTLILTPGLAAARYRLSVPVMVAYS